MHDFAFRGQVTLYDSAVLEKGGRMILFLTLLVAGNPKLGQTTLQVLHVHHGLRQSQRVFGLLGWFCFGGRLSGWGGFGLGGRCGVCKQSHSGCPHAYQVSPLTSNLLPRGGEGKRQPASSFGSRPCSLFKGPSSQAVRHSPGGLCQQPVGSQDAVTSDQ